MNHSVHRDGHKSLPCAERNEIFDFVMDSKQLTASSELCQLAYPLTTACLLSTTRAITYQAAKQILWECQFHLSDLVWFIYSRFPRLTHDIN